jgi:phage FluMu gp28-like protein
MCNPLGAATANIVEWSAIERCRFDYPIARVHLESDQLLQHFGEFNPRTEPEREEKIERFLRESFPTLLESYNAPRSNAPRSDDALRSNAPHGPFRLGFDVAASGQGNLAAFYIDEPQGDLLWLRALLTARTEDWHFLKTVLFYFLRHLRNIQAAGDESGLGRQICWEAASKFSSRFTKVNFAAKKHDLGFALMNQLAVAEKRFPRSEQDIATDYFALRKVHTGTRWTFNEGRNTLNPASHCDIAWAGALATHAHTQRPFRAGAIVV